MRALMIAGAAALLVLAVDASAEDPPAGPTPRVPPPAEITVKVQASEGASDADIAAGIAAENARRDPAAQEAARVAKQKADDDAAHQARVAKICDSIPEKSLRDDPSLRKMCGSGGE